MKNLTLILFVQIFILNILFCQTYPINGDFETWSNNTTPTGWTMKVNGTFNNILPLSLTLGSRSTDAHSGNYAVKLVPSQIPMTEYSLPGLCQLGNSENVNISLEDIQKLLEFANNDFSNFSINDLSTINELTHLFARGSAIHEIPSELRAWIKFQPENIGNDRATIFAAVFNTVFSIRIPVAFGVYSTTETITNYQQIQFPFYKTPTVSSCDSIIIIMMSNSSEINSQPELYVDDVELLFDTWGIKENNPILNIYPNPAHEQITLTPQNNANFDITIFDLTGKTILKKKNIQETLILNTLSFSPGTYILQTQQNKNINYQKIIIY